MPRCISKDIGSGRAVHCIVDCGTFCEMTGVHSEESAPQTREVNGQCSCGSCGCGTPSPESEVNLSSSMTYLLMEVMRATEYDLMCIIGKIGKMEKVTQHSIPPLLELFSK